MARAAHRRDRPPPPAGKHRAISGDVTILLTPRDDEAVLHEPRVHALLEKLRRSKKGFEPAADDVQRAVRHERRAREHAHDQIIAEPVEVAWRVEPPRAPRHPPPIQKSDPELEGRLRCSSSRRNSGTDRSRSRTWPRARTARRSSRSRPRRSACRTRARSSTPRRTSPSSRCRRARSTSATASACSRRRRDRALPRRRELHQLAPVVVGADDRAVDAPGQAGRRRRPARGQDQAHEHEGHDLGGRARAGPARRQGVRPRARAELILPGASPTDDLIVEVAAGMDMALVVATVADEDMQKRPPLIRVQFGPASSCC